MIKNTPKADDRVTQLLRAAFSMRAQWMYYFIEEAKANGCDPEFARKAVFKCGCMQAKSLPDTDDPVEFGNAFVKPENAKVFDMITKSEDGVFEMNFHYCPLVAAWQALGADDEYVAWLCDVAMTGDAGIVEKYKKHFTYELGSRIAYGDDKCVLRLIKNEKYAAEQSEKAKQAESPSR